MLSETPQIAHARAVTLVFVLSLLSPIAACGGPSAPPVVAKAPPPPASTSVVAPPTASTPPPPPPLTCETLCQRANQVAGCATAPANVAACTEVCTRMSAGPCKDPLAAELACAARIELACKGSAVDWGACSTVQAEANVCVRAALDAEQKKP